MSSFSIVIPAYNQPKLLKRAVESVLQQQGVTFEIIISDDSTNNSIALYAEQLANPKVHYIHHDQTRNPIDNWNFGLQAATGDYLILMHHDEAMDSPDHLTRIEQLMDKGSDLVISQVEVLHNGRQKRATFPALKRFICNHPAGLFFINAIGPCACITFRKTQLEYFDSRLHWLVDVEWYYRMLKGRYVICDNSCKILSIHGHDGQISRSLEIMKTFQHDSLIVTDKHQDSSVKINLWLYEHLILKTKKLLGKI